MGYSYNTFAGNVGDTTFTLSLQGSDLGYLPDDTWLLYFDGVLETTTVVTVSNSIATLSIPLVNAVEVSIHRNAKKDYLYAPPVAGRPISTSELTTNLIQVMELCHEAIDIRESVLHNVDQVQEWHDEVEVWHGEVQTWHGEVQTWATEASDSADNALTYAQSANDSANTATASASQANASALSASASESNALLFANNAEASATSAMASASSASASANTAEIAKDDAEDARDIALGVAGSINEASSFSDGMSEEQLVFSVEIVGSAVCLDIIGDTGGDIHFYIDGLRKRLDCTTGDGVGGKARICLAQGTATTPNTTYVYVIPDSTVGAEPDALLLVNGNAFPAGNYSALAIISLQDLATVQTEGFLSFQRLNESITHGGKSAISWEREKIRAIGAEYWSGIDPSLSIATNATTEDDVDFHVTDGQAYQLHRLQFRSKTVMADGANVVNVSGAGTLRQYDKIMNLNEIHEIADGTALVDGDCINLVIWGNVSHSALTPCKLFVSLPRGKYTDVDEAKADTNNTAVTTIPRRFKLTGFLIAKVVLRYTTANGGTWENLLGTAQQSWLTESSTWATPNYPSNYPDNYEGILTTVTKPGASAMRMVFADFTTEGQYDFISLRDATTAFPTSITERRNDPFSFSGDLTPFTSNPILGDTLRVQFYSDPSVNMSGVNATKFEYLVIQYVGGSVADLRGLKPGITGAAGAFESGFQVKEKTQLLQEDVDIPQGDTRGVTGTAHLNRTTNAIALKNVVTAKSVSFRVNSNWGHTTRSGIRRIEFLKDDVLIPYEASWVCTATNRSSSSTEPWFAFDTALSKTGTATDSEWLATGVTELVLTVTFPTRIMFDKIVYNNRHASGAGTTPGLRQVQILYSPSTAFTPIWSDTVADQVDLFNDEFVLHVAQDVIDDQDVPPFGWVEDPTNTLKKEDSNVTFNTMADMQAYSPVVFAKTATLLGYNSEGDGGGGEFYWDATSTDTANGGTVIKPNGYVIGSWVRVFEGAIHAIWFGLVNDFTTDNYTALSDWVSTLSTSNLVGVLPEGYYGISQSLVFPELNGLHIYGAGKDATFLIPLAGFDVNSSIMDFSSADRTSTKQRLNLHDFGLYSENAPVFGYAKYGINIASRTYSHLKNIRTTRVSSDSAIYSDYAWNNTFDSLNLSTQTGLAGTGGVGLSLIDECNANVIIGCDFGGSGDGTHGVFVNGTCIATVIMGGSIQSFTTSGISFGAATNSRAITVQGVYFEGGLPIAISIQGSINDSLDIKNNYFHGDYIDVKVEAGAKTKNLHIHDNVHSSGVTILERGTGAYLLDALIENSKVEMDGPLYVIGDENPERLSLTISEPEQSIINTVKRKEISPTNSTDMMNKHILSWESDGVPTIAYADSSAITNDHIASISGTSGSVSNTVVPVITASKNMWMRGGWVSLILPVSGYSGTATIRIYDGVTNHDITVSPKLGVYETVVLQAKLDAAATECTVYILPNGSSLQYATPILYTGLRAKDFTFNRDLKIYGSIVWDPASIADSTGITSPSINVAGAKFGDMVSVAAPYNAANLIITGFVSGDDTVVIRLQNETGGTVDLGSGTWVVHLHKT